MADWPRRHELKERERSGVGPPPVALPAPRTDPAAESRTRGVASGATLALALGAAGAAFALTARALTISFAGPLPYDAPGTLEVVLQTLVAGAVAVIVAIVNPVSDADATSSTGRVRRSALAAAPLAALTIAFGFAVQGARDEARAYEAAEQQSVSLDVLEHRAAQREGHAMSQFALGAEYLRDHRYVDAQTRLGYAYELDPHNVRAAELRRHAVEDMAAERHPSERDARIDASRDSITTLKIERYYAGLYAAGDHSGPVYEGILAGLRLEKRYDDAITLADMYLREHPGDPLWTARIAELRAASRVDPEAVRAALPVAASPTPELERMRELAAKQPAGAWTEATFAFAYLRASISQHPFRPDSLLAAADVHTRRAIALAPNSAPYRVQLGLIRFLAGDYAGCDSAFTAAARLDPRAVDRHPDNARLWRTAQAHLGHLPTPPVESFTLTPPPRP